MVQTRNLEQYKIIHQSQAYGQGAAKTRRRIGPWVVLKRPLSMLDYGAGRSKMVDLINSPGLSVRHRFDPAISEIATVPLSSYDLVTCTDVLEHLDESEINQVLAHIKSLSAAAIIAADTRPASTVLPSGENAHATVQPPEWWQRKIEAIFGCGELIHVSGTSAIFRTWHATPLDTAKAFWVRFTNKSEF